MKPKKKVLEEEVNDEKFLNFLHNIPIPQNFSSLE
jgi:hypothetical protein